jgi:hypothetical protein
MCVWQVCELNRLVDPKVSSSFYNSSSSSSVVVAQRVVR